MNYIICPYCTAQLPFGSNFCSFCKHPIGQPQAPQQPYQGQQAPQQPYQQQVPPVPYQAQPTQQPYQPQAPQQPAYQQPAPQQPAYQPQAPQQQPYQEPQPVPTPEPPTEPLQQADEPTHEYDEPKSNSTLKIIIGVIIAIVLLGGGGVGYYFYDAHQKEVKRLKALAEEEDSEKDDESDESSDSEANADTTTAADAFDEAPAVSDPEPDSDIDEGMQGEYVVINGSGVRMRLGPGTEYDFPVNASGHAYTVPKGTALPYLGTSDDGEWYAVEFEGGRYYVSARFAYLQ